MGRNTWARCKDCKKPRTPKRHISRHGLCGKCGVRRHTEAMKAQAKMLDEMAAQGLIRNYDDR